MNTNAEFKLMRFSFCIMITLCTMIQYSKAQDKGSCSNPTDTLTIYADYANSDANYSNKKITWSDNATETINTFSVVNSGPSGRVGFNLSTQSSVQNAGESGCVKNADREIRLFESSIGVCEWESGIVASVADGGNQSPWSNPEFYNLKPNTFYIVQVRTTVETNCSVSEQYLTYYQLPLVLSLSEPLDNKLSVYPNPANDLLTIILPSCMKTESKIELYSIESKMLLQLNAPSTINTIEISSFPKGIYLLKASSRELTIVDRIIFR